MKIDFDNIEIGDKIVYNAIIDGSLIPVEMVITDDGWDMFAKRLDNGIEQQIKRTAILEHFKKA